MTQMLITSFTSAEDLNNAIEHLQKHNIETSDFSIVTSEKNKAKLAEHSDKTAEMTTGGVATGVGSGAVIGAGLATLITTGIAPVLGGFLIGGPIVAALGLTGEAATITAGAITGATAGGVTGGLIGALTGLGLTDEEAEAYNQVISEGGYLLAVTVNDYNRDIICKEFESHNSGTVKEVSVNKQ